MNGYSINLKRGFSFYKNPKGEGFPFLVFYFLKGYMPVLCMPVFLYAV